jgi:hypothetical protein
MIASEQARTTGPNKGGNDRQRTLSHSLTSANKALRGVNVSATDIQPEMT